MANVAYHTHQFEIPTATEADGAAGIDDSKAMTSVATKAAIGAQAATIDQGVKADTAMQPSVYDPDNVGEEVAFRATSQMTFADIATAVTAHVPDGIGKINTQFYALANLLGAASYRQSSSSEVVPYPSSSWFTTNSGTRYWLLTGAEVTAPMFGAKMDGTTDDKNALAALIAFSAVSGITGVIPSAGTLATSALSYTLVGNVNIRCEGTIKNVLGSSLAANLIDLDGSSLTYSVKWRGGKLDGNGGPRSLLRCANCNVIDVMVDEVTGIICDENSPAVTGALLLQSANSLIASIGWAHGMSRGTSTQGSIPRVYSINNCIGALYAGILEDVVDCLTCSEVNLDWYGPVIRRPLDQCCYLIGQGEVRFHSPHIEDAEEPFVVSNESTFDPDALGKIKAFGGSLVRATNAMGLQNSGSIMLYGMDIELGTGESTAATLVRTRGNPVPNVRSLGYEIRGCRIHIDLMAVSPFAFTNGQLDKFLMEGNRFIFNYVADKSPSTNIMTWSGGVGKQFLINDNTFELISTTGDIPDGTTMFFNLPPAVTELSTFKGNRWINNTGKNSVVFRVNNARQQLVTFDELFCVTNIGSDDEINVGGLATAPPRVVWGTGVPTQGYWSAGSIVNHPGPTAGAACQWRCLTSGSPGAWAVSAYAQLQGANGYSGETIAAGAFGTEVTITLNGVDVGDFLLSFAPSVLSKGEVWLGRISGSNQVKARPLNMTASSITTTSGNIRVRAQKL